MAACQTHMRRLLTIGYDGAIKLLPFNLYLYYHIRVNLSIIYLYRIKACKGTHKLGAKLLIHKLLKAVFFKQINPFSAAV